MTALILLLSPVLASAQTSVALLDYKAVVPAGWTSKTPSSDMRLAEFVVPSPAGKADVVVYFFGSGRGGDIDANLERWRGQFSSPDGKPVYEKTTSETVGAISLTIAEFRGTYDRGMGTGGNGEAARPNNTLLAVIAETAAGTMYFQLFGDSKAVDAARDAYMTFVRSLK